MMTVPKTDNTINTKHVQIHANAAGVDVTLLVEVAILFAATQAMMNAQRTNTNDNSHAMVITFLALVTQQQILLRQQIVKSVEENKRKLEVGCIRDNETKIRSPKLIYQYTHQKETTF